MEMKKCPKCNRNIPSDANICPYCGQPQPGYVPPGFKKNNHKKTMYLYLIIAILLVNIPFVLSYMFAYNGMNDDFSSEKITLAAYQESSKETVQYQYESLKDFSEKVTNSDTYVEKINDVENQLNEMIDNDQFEKDYLFQITQNNNVYALINYEITAKTGSVYQIEYSYNLSGDSQCDIVINQNDFKSIDEIDQILTEHQNDYNAIIRIFNGKDNTQLLNDTKTQFDKIKGELGQEKISHYGKGVSQSSSTHRCAIRVFGQQESYRLKMTFQTQLKKKNFM